ncbi:MAG: hypothetical protein JSV12_00335 [Candidatus Bathyarchaeota archaeon]|nr:MAG: hypothetical protein JSV12_00335 [Candidatus Bathyarchaeota archaeon]
MGITAPEYWEYQKRKTKAQAENYLGVIACAVGVGGALFSIFFEPFRLLLPLFVVMIIVGGFMVRDSNERLQKIKHIYWTKQALREYEEAKYKVLEGVESEASHSVGMTREGYVPIDVEIFEEDDPTPQKERISKLLDKLDERLVSGEISESIYKELKSKYQAKLKQMKEEIKLYEQVDFSKLREILISHANEKYLRKLLPERDKFIYFVSETLGLPSDERNVTNRNLLKCAQILNIEIPRRTAKNE